MISWVSSTRHISGFLSWPSYTMACVGDKQRQGSRSAYRTGATPPRAPQASRGGRCPAPTRGGDRHTRPPSHPATSVSCRDASHCSPAQLFPRAHPGPELRRAAGRARQGLPRPGHSLRGRTASQPAPGAWATATWRRPLPIVLYEGPIAQSKKLIRVRCDYRRQEDAGLRGSPPCATRAPQPPAPARRARTHTHYKY